ncbi:hypothetical protein Rsub_12989 [Raphidocelis subcapitata]|uniref:RAP domain-containing protein n=1 Tax=Raphidocelis subcapitata TaxID=307507 RepID=A0A2V0PRK3_9CHLO|nr:hypothetical protein Rsub_12989 [Raphidocelis subcapitata]|eukprot:GBG00208.1 hypothetical protein Rsub_12989 [Raphidocelis subcapitata]
MHGRWTGVRSRQWGLRSGAATLVPVRHAAVHGRPPRERSSTAVAAAAAAGKRGGPGQDRPARRPRAPSDCASIAALQQLVSAAGRRRQRPSWYAAALSQLARIAGAATGVDDGTPTASAGLAARRLALDLAGGLQKRTGGAGPAELGTAVTALARAQRHVPELRPPLQAALRQLEAAAAVAAVAAAGVLDPSWDGAALLAAARGLTDAKEAGEEPAPGAVAAIAAASCALALRGGDAPAQDTAAAVCALAQLDHFDAPSLLAASAALCGTPRGDGGAGPGPPRPPLAALEPPAAVSFAHALARLAWPCPPALRALASLAQDDAWLEALDPRGLAVLAWAAAMQGVLSDAAESAGAACCQEVGTSSSGAEWPACADVYACCVHALAARPGATNGLSLQWGAQLHQARVLLASGLRSGTPATAAGAGRDAAGSGRAPLAQHPDLLLLHSEQAWEAAQRRKTVSATQRDVWQFLTRDLGVGASLEAPAGAGAAGLTVDVALSAEAAAQAFEAASGTLPAGLDGAPVALEVDGPSHFASNGARARLGPTVARDWLLARLGWRVASLREWPAGGDAGARRRALAECLQRAAPACRPV